MGQNGKFGIVDRLDVRKLFERAPCTMAFSYSSILRSSISLVDPDKKGHGKVVVDYKKDDYRGFCLCIHKEHGLLMLYCTRKLNKGPHYQLAGGHVDEPEFLQACKQNILSLS
jgi:hypothetical protein